MKKFILILCLVGCAFPLFARHGKGGYLVYQYLGAGSADGTSRYKIMVVHYVNCRETQFELRSVFVGIFDNGNRSYLKTVEIVRSSSRTIQKQVFDGCINPVPDVCFFLAFYEATIELPNSQSGYVLAEQECCRAQDIANITASGETGTTNFNTIPGTINTVDYHTNSSPDMAIKDTAVICHSSPFELDFGTTDPDGDELSYSFCSATAGASRENRQPNPPAPPTYQSVNYSSPFSGLLPLGTQVAINPKTGLIKGTAPAATGNYAVAVCITETRNGVIIGTTKKEILITVADCTLSAATLAPSYINCNDFSFMFQNESYAGNISSYLWDFGTAVQDSSLLSQPTPVFTYPDTGTYKIKLKVTSGANCTDSATSEVKIYPGFSAGFTAAGSCFQSPFFFTDTSYVKYGLITQYKWDFGDIATAADTSVKKNAAYQYTKAGNVSATLVIASDKGCRDTASQQVVVNDKPQIILPFLDTLICRNDSLPIAVQSSGSVFSWTPAYNINNTTISNPVVYPFNTTNYTLTVRDKQCVDSVKLRVNVIDSVTLQIPSFANLCATDSITLLPVSDALFYTWKEAGTTVTLNNTQVKTPQAAPLQTTVYFVTGSVGHCSATTQTTVQVSPYPAAKVSGSQSICYGNTAQLKATTTAASYSWQPTGSLLNPNTLQPLAGPQQTTAYLLTISDTFYCSKSTTDTVLIQVIPPLQVDAGNDTSAVLNQPLQLSASASAEASFRWSPSIGMYNSEVFNPVVIITDPALRMATYSVTAKTPQGCNGVDSLHVTIFSSKPDIFVPSAFTPDGDGKNDSFKPITAGIAHLVFFRIYNRFGTLLYETTKTGNGWDGIFKGEKQPPGTYVYEVEASDYNGRVIAKRGSVVLIR